ncbi:MAG: proline dehydrogenase family protein, partial [Actinomycetes bacterium]
MSTPAFKAELFRLVDVFPATTGQADALTHMREYFSDPETPRLLRLGVGAADRIPGGARLAAGVARHNIARMARQFIIGSDAGEVTARAGELWEAGKASTVDLLGEKTLNQAEADVYARRVLEITEGLADAAATWPSRPLLDADDLGPVPRPSVSVKPTALSPHFQPMSAAAGLEEVEGRLEPILKAAAARGVLVWLDMEHYDVKDVTLQLLGRLAERSGLEDLQLGIVIQAYLQDADRDLTEVVERSALRVAAGRPQLWVRLVKGAYWDAETIHARAEGWSPPVWPSKPHTDAAYERLTRLLHDRHGAVRAAFGSHNVRSVAHAVSYARALGIPDHGYEIQMLYGMAEPMHDAVQRSGLRLRVYAPMGELVPGMSYLVRRLLENTANDSFVRLRFAEGADLDALLAPPAPGAHTPTSPARKPPARKPARKPPAHKPNGHSAAGPGG